MAQDVNSSIFPAVRHAGRGDVVAGSALVVVHQLAEVTVPVLIGVIIDRAVATADGGAVLRWVAVLAALFVVLSAAGCTGIYVEERATMRATHRARLAVARRVLDPAGGVEDAVAGQVVSLSTIETARLGEGVGALIIGVGALAGTAAAAAVLLITSPSLGLIVVIGVPVVLAATRALSQPLVARADAHQEAVGLASGVAADLVSGLRVLKGLGVEGAGAASYQRASAGALGAALAANRVRATYTGITLTVAGAFLVVVAALGGHQALDGTITVGQLVAAVGVTQFLLGPLGRLAACNEVLAQARASAAHLDAALSAPGAVTGGPRRLPAVVAGAVELSDLRHGPLAGIELAVQPGEHVGVAAADPAAAAALVACLDRSRDPDAGAVVVDGAALADLDLDDARRAVVVSHHDAPLFAGGVLDNAAAASPPGADVAGALAAAGAATVLDEHPGALGEGGSTLSGGQRQRVVLARALATEAPVLVLHEPTTAVDAATEHRIAAGVRARRAGRTTIVVTTSPALLAATDRVVLVDGGRIVAQGSHHELAADARYQAAVLA